MWWWRTSCKADLAWLVSACEELEGVVAGNGILSPCALQEIADLPSSLLASTDVEISAAN